MATLATEVIPRPMLADLDFFPLMDCVKQIGEAFAAAGHDIAPILGDNAISNTLLVDFDFAGVGDPLCDIARFCLEACSYVGDGTEEIVEMHLGAARSDILARVRLLMLVEDVVWAAWAARLHATSPRKDTCEFFSYAGVRLLRASHTLAGMSVPSLMRAI
jgi:hypothetical protein